MKLHLRELSIGGTPYRLVTLRPGTQVAFNTNFLHQTWHVVSDMRGARMIARLLWGLAFQRWPGTLVLIHDQHLLPTPFEAEPSDPFLLIPAHLTSLHADNFRELKRQLGRLAPPSRTIRWLTFGLDAALQAWKSKPPHHFAFDLDRKELSPQENQKLWKQERMVRCGGFNCYAAPSPILRYQALRIHSLHVSEGDYLREMDYHFLAQTSSKQSWYGDGEVQIFADYHDRVAAAVQARQQLIPYPQQPVLSETLQELISRKRDQIKMRRKRNRFD
jgi:hypothetical protein